RPHSTPRPAARHRAVRAGRATLHDDLAGDLGGRRAAASDRARRGRARRARRRACGGAAMSEALAVLRVGMTCPVGLDAPQTTAAIRAGVARKLETSMLDARLAPVILGHLADELLPPLDPSLAARGRLDPLEARMLRLASGPLRELLSKQFSGATLPVHLAAPQGLVSERFLPELARQAGVGIEPSASRVFAGGGASLFEA